MIYHCRTVGLTGIETIRVARKQMIRMLLNSTHKAWRDMCCSTLCKKDAPDEEKDNCTTTNFTNLSLFFKGLGLFTIRDSERIMQSVQEVARILSNAAVIVPGNPRIRSTWAQQVKGSHAYEPHVGCHVGVELARGVSQELLAMGYPVEYSTLEPIRRNAGKME
jgi:hypothetical protein